MEESLEKRYSWIGFRYIFTDYTVKSSGRYLKDAKKFVEFNSRGKYLVDYKMVNVRVPFKHEDYKEAIHWVKDIYPIEDYDMNIHFCKPKRSMTGGGTVRTASSKVNCRHEVMHSIGLGHSFNNLSGKIINRDPYDVLQIGKTYGSLNSPHLLMINWFNKSEFIDIDFDFDYKLNWILSENQNTLKCLIIGSDEGDYFLSLVDKQSKNKYLALHKRFGNRGKLTLLIGTWKLAGLEEFFYGGLHFKVFNFDGESCRVIVNEIAICEDCKSDNDL
jgi:hypothetical protein